MLLQFKIQLKNISDPPVWRRVLVPDSFSFANFHDVIQAAFGWQNSHLYQFSPKGYGSYPTFTIPSPEYEDEVEDSEDVSLSEVFKRTGKKFTYIYDFGDDWVHQITLEKKMEGQSPGAELVDGKGACPPEDCGGPWGYQNLLAIMNDTTHEEYESMRDWLGLEEGEIWDAAHFDIEKARENTARI